MYHKLPHDSCYWIRSAFSDAQVVPCGTHRAATNVSRSVFQTWRRDWRSNHDVQYYLFTINKPFFRETKPFEWIIVPGMCQIIIWAHIPVPSPNHHIGTRSYIVQHLWMCLTCLEMDGRSKRPLPWTTNVSHKLHESEYAPFVSNHTPISRHYFSVKKIQRRGGRYSRALEANFLTFPRCRHIW